MTTDPAADIAQLVSRALLHGTVVLALLVAGLTATGGVGAVVTGLVLVGALRLVVGVWARRRLSADLDRAWEAVETRWSQSPTT